MQKSSTCWACALSSALRARIAACRESEHEVLVAALVEGKMKKGNLSLEKAMDGGDYPTSVLFQTTENVCKACGSCGDGHTAVEEE